MRSSAATRWLNRGLSMQAVRAMLGHVTFASTERYLGVATDQLVLISPDGIHWGFAAGRPEPGETIEETLRREMLEEACVRVVGQRLLGFARSECVEGHEKGLVLVRSYWRAEVEIQPWDPRFEIRHRKGVAASDAKIEVRDPDEVATRISPRALDEAGLG